MGARWEGGGGVSWAQFFRKSVGHMAPRSGEMEKGASSGHENGTFYGFIM